MPSATRVTRSDPANPGQTIPLVCCSSDLGNYFGNNANSNYNALQVKAEKRMSNGLQFISHFTWSRALHYDSNYFVDDPHVAYGPDQSNRNKVFVMNVVYDLPFGKGRRWAASDSQALLTTSSAVGSLPSPPTGAAGCRLRRAQLSATTKKMWVSAVRTRAVVSAWRPVGLDAINHSVNYYTPVDISRRVRRGLLPGPAIWATRALTL